MYTPRHFAMDDLAQAHDLMEQWSFAALVSAVEDRPEASHLPFLLDRERGPFGTLLSHMARANPQWRSFDGHREVLVVFQAEHAYVSPSWYAVHPSVPTWNYAVVHAYGVPRVVEDPPAVLDLLRRTVTRYESERPEPWPMDLSETYLSRMIKGIVAFEIELVRVEGKHKLSQNRSREDRAGVVEGLGESRYESDRAMAELMRARLAE